MKQEPRNKSQETGIKMQDPRGQSSFELDVWIWTFQMDSASCFDSFRLRSMTPAQQPFGIKQLISFYKT